MTPEKHKEWEDAYYRCVDKEVLQKAYEEDVDPTPICKMTGTYCTGQFCDEYGCAKESGFYDNQD